MKNVSQKSGVRSQGLETRKSELRCPKVSVVMATFNAREYLREAIESILNQTFKDFEFLIIDDGSTDDTVAIIESYKDSRIVLYQRRHKGLVNTLNYGIKIAQGEYVARMDADDISEPRRFELEVKFLDSHPGHAMVGTTTETISAKGRFLDISAEPLEHEDLVRGLLVRNVFAHGSVMMRRKVALEMGGYDPKAIHAEDYDLWTRVVRKYRVANLPQLLFKWRFNPRGVSITGLEVQHETAGRIKRREWEYYRKNHTLPCATLREVLEKRWQRGTKDRFWRRRLNTLSLIYSQSGRKFLLKGKRLEALREVSQALILDPLRLENYFYLVMLIIPIKFFLFVEKPLKSVKRVVLHALGKPVL